jgi:carboxypeptidase C (cathepsin A)
MMSCYSATSTCSMELEQPFWATGLNPYDISKPCDGPIEETLCYPFARHIITFLNLLKTRKMLGVSNRVPGHYGCSEAVQLDFESHLDIAKMTTPYVEALLERGVRVLIYVGTNDWIWFVKSSSCFRLAHVTRHLAIMSETIAGLKPLDGQAIKHLASSH